MDNLDNMTIKDLYKEYYSGVRSIAEELADEFKLEGPAVGEQDEAVQTRLHELVDSSEWVIYTFQSRLVGLLSENNDAYLDTYSEKEAVAPEVIAFTAMEADVQELMSNVYFWQDQVKRLNVGKVA